MLAQEIAAVIVAIWRAHDGMDVVARRLVVVVDDARLVVELDEDYRREDPVIERAMVVDRADPGEMSLRLDGASPRPSEPRHGPAECARYRRRAMLRGARGLHAVGQS